jgi:hypothetical protein
VPTASRPQHGVAQDGRGRRQRRTTLDRKSRDRSTPPYAIAQTIRSTSRITAITLNRRLRASGIAATPMTHDASRDVLLFDCCTRRWREPVALRL